MAPLKGEKHEWNWESIIRTAFEFATGYKHVEQLNEALKALMQLQSETQQAPPGEVLQYVGEYHRQQLAFYTQTMEEREPNFFQLIGLGEPYEEPSERAWQDVQNLLGIYMHMAQQNQMETRQREELINQVIGNLSAFVSNASMPTHDQQKVQGIIDFLKAQLQ